ncbi:hypothetical protein KSP39_PZI017098 [Platanthera zijinensis]|uniref:Uncharacterized protein n=1 Tax=Platanthera zijinensis TaxID=2320716 RepID=A0AAP0B5D0_9ASPA
MCAQAHSSHHNRRPHGPTVRALRAHSWCTGIPRSTPPSTRYLSILVFSARGPKTLIRRSNKTYNQASKSDGPNAGTDQPPPVAQVAVPPRIRKYPWQFIGAGRFHLSCSAICLFIELQPNGSTAHKVATHGHKSCIQPSSFPGLHPLSASRSSRAHHGAAGGAAVGLPGAHRQVRWPPANLPGVVRRRAGRATAGGALPCYFSALKYWAANLPQKSLLRTAPISPAHIEPFSACTSRFLRSRPSLATPPSSLRPPDGDAITELLFCDAITELLLLREEHRPTLLVGFSPPHLLLYAWTKDTPRRQNKRIEDLLDQEGSRPVEISADRSQVRGSRQKKFPAGRLWWWILGQTGRRLGREVSTDHAR